MSGELTVATERNHFVSQTGSQIIRGFRRYAIFLILAALIIFFNAIEPAFLRANNLFSVLQSVAVVVLLGIGVTVTLAVDGFDLSVGSVAAFTLMLTSYAMVVLQFSALETVFLALLAGATIGLINGLLIVGLRIPDLLATLGMMSPGFVPSNYGARFGQMLRIKILASCKRRNGAPSIATRLPRLQPKPPPLCVPTLTLKSFSLPMTNSLAASN